MFRKMVALFLIIAMLVPLSSAAAADEPSESRSMEEILDEYHRLAFGVQDQGNTRTTSPNSHSGGKTLEEETVDALTEAGYEAYNVTAANYDTLEQHLQTDFAAIGLNRESSYIVVIHGKPGDTASNGNSRIWDPPTQDDFDNGDGGNREFNFTYGSTTYRMRYLIVTSADGVSGLTYGGTYTLNLTHWLEDAAVSFWDNLFMAGANYYTSALTGVNLGSLASLLINSQLDDNYTRLELGTLTVHSSTVWKVEGLQIWSNTENEWRVAQASASAMSRATLAGYVYDPVTGASNFVSSDEQYASHYSPNYDNYSQRQIDAVLAFNRGGEPAYDKTGNVKFYLAKPSGEIIFDSEGRPLITHYEHWSL